ncbi:putative acetyltransferase EpsM [Crateriforma conspicua]|uniref:Putative acetyltransferase EpsM n=1 Tax=Crateriforma conspicua TaxID=2527996 RepID=A0A5C6FZF0_9PLAN|nr:acetyltransferase [Crateriforma conspicua]TWU66995.1 putative acetyltransferase EpsM [Crateriforma conspicua]
MCGTPVNSVIFGCGDHANVVRTVIEAVGKYRFAGYISQERSSVGGVREMISGHDGDPNSWYKHGILGIGDNQRRFELSERVLSSVPDYEFIRCLHPKSIISDSASVALGTVVMPNVTIQANTSVGRHCIINTSSSIDHDCHIDDFSFIGPGSVLAGRITIGERACVNTGVVIAPGVKISPGAVIGAGSVVLNSIPANVLAYGSPARVVRELHETR